MLAATAVLLVGINFSACSEEAGDSAAVTEHGITQDINAVRSQSSTTLPAGARLVKDRQVSRTEPSVAAGSDIALGPASRPGNLNRPPSASNISRRRVITFAVGTCTPCHVVSQDRKSPFRFANAPDFRVIANARRTTAIGLNIWLTSPRPTMPKLVHYPQEAVAVILYP